MNNFNRVFLAIKRQCEQQTKFAEISCFDAVAKEANAPLSKLGIYLSHLQDLGLIKYSITDNYLYLTSFGKKQEKLITE